MWPRANIAEKQTCNDALPIRKFLLDGAGARGLLATAAAAAVLAISAPAQADVSFQGQSVKMIIGSSPGGGTDGIGRIIARLLGKYLPGAPAIVVQNFPGANGVTAMNHFMRQTRPDGLTIVMGSNSSVDPLIYRNANAQYDPKSIRMVGGIGTGGTIAFLTTSAEKRLYDKSASPIVIGNVGPLPRAGMQMALWGVEFLGWNAKWVVGYPGTNELFLAMDRKEVDFSLSGPLQQITERVKAGSWKLVMQTGAVENGKVVGDPRYGSTPIFLEQMHGKIADPIARKAFDYWVAVTSVDKWVGLPGGTPDEILAVYRDAFRKLGADKEFLDAGRQLAGEEFGVTSPAKVEAFVSTLADTPPEALQYINLLMRKQGMAAN
jgi:tripartite-type tricarboxylate transporter receptor subunit TctC